MTTQLSWHVARATGVVAWALLTAAVVWGLLLSTRLARGRPTPVWLLDMHRFIGGAAVSFTLLHLGGLVADTYVHFGLADLLVPYASSWRPGAVALGVVSLYLLMAVELTSLLMRRIPRSGPARRPPHQLRPVLVGHLPLRRRRHRCRPPARPLGHQPRRRHGRVPQPGAHPESARRPRPRAAGCKPSSRVECRWRHPPRELSLARFDRVRPKGSFGTAVISGPSR